MVKYEVAPNARYHALQVEGFTLDGDQDCMQASGGGCFSMSDFRDHVFKLQRQAPQVDGVAVNGDLDCVKQIIVKMQLLGPTRSLS